MTWRPITGFPGYAVSTVGTVRRGRVEITPQSHRGYYRVRLRYPDGRRAWRRVHLLVLEAFVGPRPSSRHCGAHFPNHDPADNRVANLRWATPEDNELHKLVQGGGPSGGKRTPTSEAIVQVIRLAARAGQSFTAIGLQHGLHRSSVARIVRGLRRAS